MGIIDDMLTNKDLRNDNDWVSIRKINYPVSIIEERENFIKVEIKTFEVLRNKNSGNRKLFALNIPSEEIQLWKEDLDIHVYKKRNNKSLKSYYSEKVLILKPDGDMFRLGDFISWYTEESEKRLFITEEENYSK